MRSKSRSEQMSTANLIDEEGVLQDWDDTHDESLEAETRSW